MGKLCLLSLVFLFSFGLGEIGEATPSKASVSRKTAVFAGGCFWCMQPPYDALSGEGVLSTRVGYAGGAKGDADYTKVSSGQTSHLEVIEVSYDPGKISYEKLLEVFWRNIDPYDDNGQFCDKGRHYRSAVFYSDEIEKKAFEKSKQELLNSKKLKGEIATVAIPLEGFYAGEDYHQDYYKKNPLRYKFYRLNCGRDARLNEVWGEGIKK